MTVSKLILVKHSLPVIDLNLPPNRWILSQEGRNRCTRLAQQLAPYRPEEVFSSDEPKALRTAQIIADILGIAYQTVNDLHEHERPKPGLLSAGEFEQQVNALFTYPEQIVFGAESASQAQKRFHLAVMSMISRYQGKTILIVAHGTVISLFLQATCQLEPYPIWKSLGLPSFVVLSLPDFNLEKMITSIANDAP